MLNHIKEILNWTEILNWPDAKKYEEINEALEQLIRDSEEAGREIDEFIAELDRQGYTELENE